MDFLTAGGGGAGRGAETGRGSKKNASPEREERAQAGAWNCDVGPRIPPSTIATHFERTYEKCKNFPPHIVAKHLDRAAARMTAEVEQEQKQAQTEKSDARGGFPTSGELQGELHRLRVRSLVPRASLGGLAPFGAPQHPDGAFFKTAAGPRSSASSKKTGAVAVDEGHVGEDKSKAKGEKGKPDVGDEKNATKNENNKEPAAPGVPSENNLRQPMTTRTWDETKYTTSAADLWKAGGSLSSGLPTGRRTRSCKRAPSIPIPEEQRLGPFGGASSSSAESRTRSVSRCRDAAGAASGASTSKRNFCMRDPTTGRFLPAAGKSSKQLAETSSSSVLQNTSSKVRPSKKQDASVHDDDEILETALRQPSSSSTRGRSRSRSRSTKRSDNLLDKRGGR
ncbi:unnamed protein product [Amoebophrya sp. A120]|nr:unnamed protein product [Amoebophrya sp. A120]|eukprot:GSA120T00009486001.1